MLYTLVQLSGVNIEVFISRITPMVYNCEVDFTLDIQLAGEIVLMPPQYHQLTHRTMDVS